MKNKSPQPSSKRTGPDSSRSNHRKRLDSESRSVLRSRRVVTPEGVRPADVVLNGGSIESVSDYCSHAASRAEPRDGRVQDFGDAVIMPGLIDVHCHINEPGRTEWEGFHTATRAAAAGGITALADMPLNSEPVTTTTEAFEAKVASTRSQLQVDVALYGGVVPANSGDHQTLTELSRAGAAGFKCFLCDSGLPSFPKVERRHLELAMPHLASLGKRLLAHAELFQCEPSNTAQVSTPPASYADNLEARPPEVEERAINLLAELCEATGCAVHIVHLSAASALPRLQALRAQGLPITVETCPHYLTFEAEALSLDPVFKCTPPIRDAENRALLWRGLADGIIDFVATDHSPCPPQLKHLETFKGSDPQPGELWAEAWGGIASLQLLLPAVWTEASRRNFGIDQVRDWLSSRPAAWLGLNDRGVLRAGARADLVVWQPEAQFTVEASSLEHRHPITPYQDLQLSGVVIETVHNGRTIFRWEDGRPQFDDPPNGKVVRIRHQVSRGEGNVYPGFEQFFQQREPVFEGLLRDCCGSTTWLARVSAALPLPDATTLFHTSELAFDALERDDWLEAFAAHPRIGDLASLQKRFASTEEAARAEQAGAQGASPETLQALANANEEYEKKFGFVFLICATGKSADQMLHSLTKRLSNGPETELAIAAEEQRKITFLRLEKLFE